MARRTGPDPHTTKPRWSTKTWEQLSERTRRRWGHSAEAWYRSTPETRLGRNKGRVSVPTGTPAQAGGSPAPRPGYWQIRANNLARKLGHHSFFDYPASEQAARSYFLGGGMKPYQTGQPRQKRTGTQKKHIREYLNWAQPKILLKRQDLTASSYPQEIYGN